MWILRDAILLVSVISLWSGWVLPWRKEGMLSLTLRGARSSRMSNPLSAIKELSLSNKSRRPLCRVSSLSWDTTRIELWYKNHSTWWWYANKAFVSVVIFVAGEDALLEMTWMNTSVASMMTRVVGYFLKSLGICAWTNSLRGQKKKKLQSNPRRRQTRVRKKERTPPLVVNNVAGPCCCFFSNPDRSATVLLALKMLVGWKTSIKGYFSVIISNWHQAKLVSTAIYPPSV